MLATAACALLVLALAALCARRYAARRPLRRLARELHSGFTTLPLLGHSYLFFGNNNNIMSGLQALGRDALRNENGLCPLWLGHRLYTVIADPEAADFVLKTCLEKDDIMKIASYFVGNGSIFAPVSIWKPRRKVLVPTFGPKNMKHFLEIFNKQSNVLVQRLSEAVDAGSVSAWRYYTAYTMDAITEATLGYEMHAQKASGHPFLSAFDEGLAQAAKRMCSPWLHSDLVYHNLPVYAKLGRMKDYMWRFIKQLIEINRSKIKNGQEDHVSNNASEDRFKTFLELLIKYSGGDDGYTDVEVIEELMVIMIAGNDTSAVSLSFTSLMLATHLDVQDKVFEELQEVFGDSERSVTTEDLSRLKYLDAVIKETLRLYTPVPVITRKIERDIILPSGQKLVGGSGAMVNIWALHRNPCVWGADAEQFRPERFLTCAPAHAHRAAFMPFSYGPRNCLGYQFAMTSLKTALSSVLRRYHVLPACPTCPTCSACPGSGRPLRLKFDLMMKDADGFQIRLKRRTQL